MLRAGIETRTGGRAGESESAWSAASLRPAADAHMHVGMHVRMHAHMRVHMRIGMCVDMRVDMRVHMRVGMRVDKHRGIPI